MAISTKQVDDLLDKGALLGIPDPELIFHPAVVEIGRGQLYWVNKFPNDQSDTHIITYDNIDKVGEVGLSFLSRKRVVAYLATYDQWPESNIDDYREEKSRWTEYLKDSNHRDNFQNFVADNRS